MTPRLFATNKTARSARFVSSPNEEEAKRSNSNAGPGVMGRRIKC